MDKFKAVDIKALLYLGDQVYEAHLKDGYTNKIKEISVNESEAITSSNLLGVITSNTLNLDIIDKTGELNINNKQSRYKDGFDKGSKVEIYRQDTESLIGVYFTDSWNNKILGNSNICTVYCYDRLSYIGNKEIPDIEMSDQITIGELIRKLFTAIGLVENTDYKISGSLNNKLTQLSTITKGKRIKDTLNEIAKALIARIVCDRYGVIIIKPAFDISGEEINLNIDNLTSGLNIKNNRDVLDYGRVRVNYINISRETEPSILAMKLDQTFQANDTVSINFDLPNNVQVIDAVDIYTDSDEESGVMVSAVSYNKGTGGINVEFINTSPNAVVGNVYIRGRCIVTSNAYVMDSNAEQNKDKTMFETENLYIQNAADALTYANNIMSYINNMKVKFSINGFYDMAITNGSILNIRSKLNNLDGKFYVTDIHYIIGSTYCMNVQGIVMKN